MRPIPKSEYLKRIQTLPITLIGDYKNMSTRAKHQCDVCGNIWNPKPKQVTNPDHRCEECAFTKKMNDYLSLLKTIPVTLIGEYKDTNTYIKHQCDDCGHQWDTPPSHIKSDHLCKPCSIESQKCSVEDYRIKIKDTTFNLIGDYTNAQTPTEHQCKKCLCIRLISPTNITDSGNGCKECHLRKTAEDIYRGNRTLIYYLYIKEYDIYKVGVTMESISQRYNRTYYDFMNRNPEVISSKWYEDGMVAWELEQKIIQHYRASSWQPTEDEKFVGWTECFTKDVLRET